MAVWSTTGQIGFQSPLTDTSFITSKGANVIVAGDLIAIVCGVGDASGASVDPGSLSSPGFAAAVNQQSGSAAENLRAA